ncbi:hypothetical protein ACYZUD_11620 [Pseudomonas sp. XS1P51]
MKMALQNNKTGTTRRRLVSSSILAFTLFGVLGAAYAQTPAATNEGGKFTAQEQASAQALMRQQARLATGYYSGPADQEKNWKDPFTNDPFGRASAALDFLDNMSPEEKATPEWLSQHLALEAALNQSASVDPAEKKTGHFHNLAEILAGVVTDGSDTEQSSEASSLSPR